MSGWRLQDYHCAECGVTTESLEQVSALPDWFPCACGGKSERCLSAVKTKTCWAWVDRASGPQSEPPPDVFTTKHLANDGYSYE